MAEPDASAGSRAAARFRLKRGLDLPVDGAADLEAAVDERPVSSVALLGADAPGVRPTLQVEPGERVRLGQTLFVDRRRPQLRFTAPGAGVVTAIERGARRRLEALVIELEGDAEERFEPVDPEGVTGLDREALRSRLLASGLWTSLRTRPFSRIPDPDSEPRAIFVTAMESEPLAPPAERLIASQGEDFARGLAALTHLGDAPVHVCTRPGAALPLPDLERVALAEFEGPHPAGLPGTHIHFLAPVGPEGSVWHIGYPDVIALGRLLVSGQLPTERVVALTGPAMARPRLVRTRLGASTEDLVRGELRREDSRVLSGSVLAGREATGWGAHLGRLHTQVCALPEGPRGPRGWLLPGRPGHARRLLGGRSGGTFSTELGGQRGAFFPLERMERAVPLELLVTPLLRALVVGDVERAIELGCLELAEEDLALASFLCPGKLEYGG
ncbi:MAG: NADH:ubiquinone reductase (Na(+)-transporting) subunit A, partial [Myxococcota bacterium]